MTSDDEVTRERALETTAKSELREGESVPQELQGIEAVDEDSGKGVNADPDAGPLSAP